MPFRNFVSQISSWIRSTTTVTSTRDNLAAISAEAQRPAATRVCIINFADELADWGYRATSWELVRLLNEHWPTDKPFDLKVIPLIRAQAPGREIPASFISEIRAILSNLEPCPEEISVIEELTRGCFRQFVDRLEASDLVIFQGEGTMTGTDFFRGELQLLLPWLAKHRFGKPVLSVNQTICSADSGFTRTLIRVLECLDRVWVSEPASLAWLLENGFSRGQLVGDTALLTDPLEHGNLWRSLPRDGFFCITGSAALTRDEIEPYIKAISTIAEETGLFPVFVCSTGLDRNLVGTARRFWAADRFGHAPSGLIFPAIADLLGRANFLIGGRYYLSLLASIHGTPSVFCHTNSHKLSGLRELLKVDWHIREFTDQSQLLWDAQRLLVAGDSARERLRNRVAELRGTTYARFAQWYSFKRAPNKSTSPKISPGRHRDAHAIAEINRVIANCILPLDGDTPHEKIGLPLQILPPLLSLTVYLRRGVRTRATFMCLRQLVEENLDLVLFQLNTRWLVSICDSYADFGEPLEARNALLISSFLNWERLATTYVRWSQPSRRSLRVREPIPETSEPLWDGLGTVQLKRGDTTSNTLIRYARMFAATPHLLRIWRTLLERIRQNDSVMAALDEPHGHMFDEELTWLNDERFSDVPPWRRANG